MQPIKTLCSGQNLTSGTRRLGPESTRSGPAAPAHEITTSATPDFPGASSASTRHCGSCAGLSRVCGRTDGCLIVGLSQIADRIVNAGLQRTEDIGDVLGLHTCPVGAANAGVYHPDLTAAPHRSRLSNGDAIARSIREFDGPQPVPRMPLILHIIDLQIMPIASSPRYLVHVLKIFLVIARIAMNIAPFRHR